MQINMQRETKDQNEMEKYNMKANFKRTEAIVSFKSHCIGKCSYDRLPCRNGFNFTAHLKYYTNIGPDYLLLILVTCLDYSVIFIFLLNHIALRTAKTP